MSGGWLGFFFFSVWGPCSEMLNSWLWWFSPVTTCSTCLLTHSFTCCHAVGCLKQVFSGLWPSMSKHALHTGRFLCLLSLCFCFFVRICELLAVHINNNYMNHFTSPLCIMRITCQHRFTSVPCVCFAAVIWKRGVFSLTGVDNFCHVFKQEIQEATSHVYSQPLLGTSEHTRTHVLSEIHCMIYDVVKGIHPADASPWSL